jgi:hypothetical protein
MEKRIRTTEDTEIAETALQTLVVQAPIDTMSHR